MTENQLIKQTLGPLLFGQCVKNCAEDQVVSDQQELCVKNCQEKTYKAFDLFMLVRSRMQAYDNRLDDVVDVSTYTGMEVEHGHDTQSELPIRHGVHVPIQKVNSTVEQAKREHGQIRDQALSLTVKNQL